MTRSRALRPTAALLCCLVASIVAGGCAPQDEAATAQQPDTTATATVSTSVVPVDEAVEALQAGAVALDVRTAGEFAAGHLVGARNIDATAPDFVDRIGKLPRDATYVVYCASGNRAGTAVATMRELGFTEVMNAGGFEDLAASGAVGTTRAPG